jgi:hypothetical protein
MTDSAPLEITITHNACSEQEVEELFTQHLIALDWGRKGPDPSAYEGRAKTDVKLFHTMRDRGAAVIAAYKAADCKPSDRLIGWIVPGTEFTAVNNLLCLPLSECRKVDSAGSFLGNLAPRSCTIQTCSNRAKGRLTALVRGEPLARDVRALHNLDVEWLVTNYLLATRLCECVWSGGRAYADIDHAGRTPEGQELLAQTTVSLDFVQEKAARLKSLERGDRVLCFFGLEECRAHCPPGVTYHAIEAVFSYLDNTASGKWLIDRMFRAPAGIESVTKVVIPP